MKTIYVENYQFSYVTKKYNYTQYKCNNKKFCKATILFYEDLTTKSFNHSGKCRMKHIIFNNKKNTNINKHTKDTLEKKKMMIKKV